jgi:hypothetical protein
MTRVLTLILFCTASLAAGVALATPSLATAFQSQPAPVRHSRSLWNWSISGGTAEAAAPATSRVKTAPHAAHPHRGSNASWWPVVVTTTVPEPATSTPTSTSTPPASTSPPPASTGSPDRAPVHAVLNAAFTLKSVDARCFDAPTATGGWPFAPTTAVHPIRGSFDEPRSPVHIGVDVEAPHDQAPVYAMQAGRVTAVTPDHFGIVPTHGTPGAYLQYWHVNLASGIKAGTVVTRRERLGTVKRHMLHVHISEYVKGCGLVDPARPDGLLADPYNTEWPTIGSLSAMVAGPRAFVPINLGIAAATGGDALADPATPIALDALRGTVDFRAAVTDMPKFKMQHNPQLPLAPAAIRAYRAPVGDTSRHLRIRTSFDGSKLLPSGSALWHFWAFGTYRDNACYFTAGDACAAQIVWHVGGPEGFDTTTVPNGPYEYCAQALTIAGVSARRCTAVTIAN